MKEKEMPDKIIGQGCFGVIVCALQSALARENIEPGKIDGIFGPKTVRALHQFYRDRHLSVVDFVSSTAWQQLLNAPPPSLFLRCLQLTAAFEWTQFRSGNPYACRVGNFDGQGLTWGVIGYTLRSGWVGKILLEVHRRHSDLLSAIAGPQTDELRHVVSLASPGKRAAWGAKQSQGSHKRFIKEPWNTIFNNLGSHPLVQAVQNEVAEREFWIPALHSAKTLQLHTPLGMALCFDVHVQNGHALHSKDRLKRYQQHVRRTNPQTQQERRRILAHIIAETCLPQWRENVLSRKTLFVEGSGQHNMHDFVLDEWGITDRETER
jgi:peptidoglycan hydrolase-like protein with peptidoglycan-binding domain